MQGTVKLKKKLFEYKLSAWIDVLDMELGCSRNHSRKESS